MIRQRPHSEVARHGQEGTTASLRSINLPQTGRGELQEISIRISKIDAVSAARPFGAPLDPYFVPALRRRTGRDRAVAAFMERDDSTREFIDRLESYLRYVVPQYVAEGKSYLTVAIGCTGGRHRSVMIAERLRRALTDVDGARVRVRHRDIGNA